MIFLLLFAALAGGASSAPLTKEAVRLLGADRVNTHALEMIWNGKDTVFVDYPTKADDAGDLGLQLKAVQRSHGRLQQFAITEEEPVGGDPAVAAIGFANADRDPAKELIVILEWPQKHYDYEGRLLEVRLFDDAKEGQAALMPMKVSSNFGLGCECYYRDDRKPERYKFATIASVKRELRRLGY